MIIIKLILFAFIFLLAMAFIAVVRFVLGIRQAMKMFKGGNSAASGNQQHNSGSQQRSNGSQQHTNQGSATSAPGGQKRKIIPQDEGEYVDFEEV